MQPEHTSDRRTEPLHCGHCSLCESAVVMQASQNICPHGVVVAFLTTSPHTPHVKSLMDSANRLTGIPPAPSSSCQAFISKWDTDPSRGYTFRRFGVFWVGSSMVVWRDSSSAQIKSCVGKKHGRPVVAPATVPPVLLGHFVWRMAVVSSL